ncbi:MAG TPA: hypothetical protein VN841_14500 [Bryobacteraceae bacterium]|nr:hypothetical protein [Bryobacteraceae bacterium]
MAKVHEYVLVLPNGTYEITKSNGPICVSQSRQEVGGRFDTFDPQLGEGFRAQYSEDGEHLKLLPNQSFEGVAGNVLIGRVHGAEMWGLNANQRQQVLFRLKLDR